MHHGEDKEGGTAAMLDERRTSLPSRSVTIFGTILVAGLMAGCGSTVGEAEENAPPSPPEEVVSPTTPETPTPENQGQTVAVRVVAEDLEFDPEEISVPRGAHVRLTLHNRDSVPHNVSIYRSAQAAEAIFIGQLLSGPPDASITYEFQAPEEPGTYFFRCDVHPITMTGNFAVE